MLTQPQVQRYSAQSGLRDIMIAEKEIILTYVLQLFSEKGHLGGVSVQGGTCLRNMHLGSQARFSTDLDFSATKEHDPEELILEMMAAFQEPYHGITFNLDDEYYETQDGRSWGINPTYKHDWNTGGVSDDPGDDARHGGRGRSGGAEARAHPTGRAEPSPKLPGPRGATMDA